MSNYVYKDYYNVNFIMNTTWGEDEPYDDILSINSVPSNTNFNISTAFIFYLKKNWGFDTLSWKMYKTISAEPNYSTNILPQIEECVERYQASISPENVNVSVIDKDKEYNITVIMPG